MIRCSRSEVSAHRDGNGSIWQYTTGQLSDNQKQELSMHGTYPQRIQGYL